MKEQETKGNIKKGISNPNIDVASFDNKNPQKNSLTAYEIFERCIKRAENLIKIPANIQKAKKSNENNCDCYRAAIVLSISALDAFVKKVTISEMLNKITGDKTLKPELQEYVTNLLCKDKLLEAARKSNFKEILEKEIKDDFEKKSFQGEWKIDTWMKKIGYENIFSEVSVERNINEKNFRKDIERFTKRRHIIAHSGDFDLNRTPLEENKIDLDDAKKCVETVKIFAESINNIINKNH